MSLSGTPYGDLFRPASRLGHDPYTVPTRNACARMCISTTPVRLSFPLIGQGRHDGLWRERSTRSGRRIVDARLEPTPMRVIAEREFVSTKNTVGSVRSSEVGNESLARSFALGKHASPVPRKTPQFDDVGRR